MRFFQGVKNSFARLMYGRNGMDQLGLAVIWCSLIVDLISMFALRGVRILGTVFYWVSLALWGYAIFRMFSRNLYKRREENSRWMQLWWKLKNGRAEAKARHADKTHKYFTCKACKAVCRVPTGKGTVEITCPKCGATIRGKT